MRIAISIVQKVLVNHFYKLNAGLSLFLFLVLFGLPYDVGGFHLAIAAIIIKSPVFLLVILAIWFLYNLKCIDYIIKQIKEPQQQFLYSLQNKGYKTCFFLLSYVQFLIYLPVITYAVFIIIIAFKNNAYACIITIVIFNVIAMLAAVAVYVKVLQRSVMQIRINLLTRVSIPITKTIATIPLLYILNKRKQMFCVTKFFALFILFLFVKLYNPDHYDVRPLLLCFMLATTANSTLVFEIRSFENKYSQVSRNFPLSLIQRFGYIILMYALLLLPELIFVWKAYPVFFHLKDYPQIVMSGVSLLCLFHASLLTGNVIMNTYIKIVFGIMLFLYFIILFNPGILLSLIILIIAFGLFHAYCYDYENNIL